MYLGSEKSPALRHPPIDIRYSADLDRRSPKHDREASRKYLDQKDKENQLIEASRRLGESLQRAKEEEDRANFFKSSRSCQFENIDKSPTQEAKPSFDYTLPREKESEPLKSPQTKSLKIVQSTRHNSPKISQIQKVEVIAFTNQRHIPLTNKENASLPRPQRERIASKERHSNHSVEVKVPNNVSVQSNKHYHTTLGLYKDTLLTEPELAFTKDFDRS